VIIDAGGPPLDPFLNLTKDLTWTSTIVNNGVEDGYVRIFSFKGYGSTDNPYFGGMRAIMVPRIHFF